MRPESRHDLLLHFPDVDGFWNHEDPALCEQQILAALSGFPETSVDYAGTLTQLARLSGIRGETDQMKSFLGSARKILDAAAAPPAERASIRWLLESGRCLVLMMIPAKASFHFFEAWKAAETAGHPDLAIDAALMMSITQPQKGRKEWLQKAIEIAESSTQPDARLWLPRLYLMSGWAAFDSRQYQDALEEFDKSLRLTAGLQTSQGRRIVEWSRGRTLRALARVEESLAAQRSLQADLTTRGESNGHVDREIAECLLLLDRGNEAKPHFASAHMQLSMDQFFSDNHTAELTRLLKLSKSG